jgi:hypothetical protein
MRMLKAIARLRRGAKDHGFEAVLRSDVIPERLRDAAERLASLFGAKPSHANETGAATPVIALEEALKAKAASATAQGPSHGPDHGGVHAEAHGSARERDSGAHPAGGVCPFTGMRADGTLAGAPAIVAPTNNPTLELSIEAPAPKVEARGSAREQNGDAKARTRKPRLRERDPARSAAVRGSAREPDVEARTSAREPAQAAVRQPKAREKDKERLAGARAVENTSARSATRPATKQSRSRTQASRKKV